MKKKILSPTTGGLKLSTVILLFAFIGAGCEKEADELVQINSINPSTQISVHLDSIFSKNNNCLLKLEGDTLFFPIFSHSDFKEIDSCHHISEIDLDDYTLIVGKIKVSSISDKISSIILTSDNNSYIIEVSIDKCIECYWAIDYLYFWKLYPKLQSEFEIKFSVN